MIRVASENSVIVYVKSAECSDISPDLAAKVYALKIAVSDSLGDFLIDIVPSYASLLVIFDPFKTDHFHIRNQLQTLLTSIETAAHGDSKTIELPVYYDQRVGPDLDRLASLHGCSHDEIINLHQQTEYLVYTIGFAPGFAYLGSVVDKIATPRLAKPRRQVPAGSVGIADRQTAVYPANSPGGWNIIGNCPLPLFDLNNSPSMPFSMGDKIKFKPISEAEFVALGGDIATINAAFKHGEAV